MKIRLITLLGICLTAGLHAEDQAPAENSAPKRSPEELNELLGPVALYPDPLISLVLPASTVPSDIVLADRFVAGGGDPAAADDKAWDASVKALTRYPDTLKWLDDNLDWTSQVGDAFISQPVEVMEAIQALRAKAKALGNLTDTPEEKIVEDDDSIRIMPAQPDSISVPTYDPEVVYERRATSQPLVYFSEPYTVGPWLGYDFDWHRHHLFHREWHEGWDYRRGHDREVYIESHARDHVWHVDPSRREIEIRHHAAEHLVSGSRKPHVVVRPKALVLAPHRGDVPHAVREQEHKAAVHAEEHKAGMHAEERREVLHNEERKTATHAEERREVLHNEERKSAAHAEERREVLHNEERKGHAEEHKAAMHVEERKAAVHGEEHKRVEEHRPAVHVEEHKRVEEHKPAVHGEEHREGSKKKDDKKREP